MRAWWLLLGACSHTAATPPPEAPAPAPAAQQATVPRSAPTQTLARIGVEQGPWIDIRIDGVDANAQLFCEKVVAIEIARGQPVKLQTMRGCAAEALPRSLRSPVQLVEIERVDANQVAVGSLITAGMPSDPDQNGSGTLQRVSPFDNLRACEAMRDQLAADDEALAMELRVSQARSLDEYAKRVGQQLHAACDSLPAKEASCAEKRGNDKTRCALDLQPQRMECDEHERRQHLIDMWRNLPNKHVPRQRSCRVP